ncbi:eukaryotic translation initiation factor 2 subunit gamma-like protein [Tanacetum coccineum]
MDPTLTKSDRLVGHVLGEVGSLLDVYIELKVSYLIIHIWRVFGIAHFSVRLLIAFFKSGELLPFGASAGWARVLAVNRRTETTTLQSVNPVCISIGEKIALRRRLRHDKHWRLIGWAKIQGGQTIEILPSSV